MKALKRYSGRTGQGGRGALLLLLSMATVLLLNTALPAVHAKPAAGDVTIYSEALADPWEDFSYASSIDFAGATAHEGTKSVAVTHTDAYGAFSVHTPTALTAADYRSIDFWGYGAAGGSAITLSLGETPSEFVEITLAAGTWTHVNVLLSDLGNPTTIERINWQDNTGAAQSAYYLDEIRVLAATDATGFPDATSDGSYTLQPGPSGVAVAPNGRVYAVVYKADHVYSWPSVTSMISGAAPDKTFGSDNGDPDNGCTAGPTATRMCGPESIAVDSNGNLFVADTYHHRILVFLNPDTDASPTQADSVLGQLDLSLAGPDTDSNPNDGVMEGFCYVRGVAIDSSNRLWAVDEFNHRVIRFDTPTVLGSMPSKVFGQADLDDHPAGCVDNPSGNTGEAQFSLPLGVAVDAQGTVYVTDLDNNRVQRFAADAANGAAAEASYTGLNLPHDVAVDKSGNVYIANTAAGQILVFAGGPAGDLVADHTFPGRNYPMGMALTAAGDLLVADCGVPVTGTDYPPCLQGPRGVYFFAAPAPAQNQPPNAVDDTITTPKGTAATGNVLENDSDPQDSALAVTSFSQPAAGTGSVTIEEDGAFTYTPPDGFTGTTSFTYVVSNAFDLTASATVNVTVTDPANPQPPVAQDDSATTVKNTPVTGNVLTNDSDPQGGTLTVTASTQPAHGTATVAANGAFTYTPETDYVGADSFTYTVRNDADLTTTGTVNINVTAEAAPKAEIYLPALAH